jgi:hypothetical protein
MDLKPVDYRKVEAMVGVAMAQRCDGKSPEAAALLQHAVLVAESEGASAAIVKARGLTELGIYYFELTDYDSAVVLLKEAVAIFRENKSPVEHTGKATRYYWDSLLQIGDTSALGQEIGGFPVHITTDQSPYPEYIYCAVHGASHFARCGNIDAAIARLSVPFSTALKAIRGYSPRKDSEWQEASAHVVFAWLHIIGDDLRLRHQHQSSFKAVLEVCKYRAAINQRCTWLEETCKILSQPLPPLPVATADETPENNTDPAANT